MNIAVIGSGYVGLVTGVCLAELGHSCVGIDNDKEKIARLKDGIVPIYEPGLEELVSVNLSKKRLSFTDNIKDGIEEAEVVFICVGTPPLKSGAVNLVYVEKVAREIAECLTTYKVIVDKSTVPVETGDRVERTIKLYNINKVSFDVVSNPEFLREGSAISDFMKPDRIVIGLASERAEKVMKRLYQPLNANILVTDIRSAELIKHASNSFLATKISFANALAEICDSAGADVLKVVEGMGLDPRIGKDFLKPGIGYGGSCFPKDVAGFIYITKGYGYDFKLLKAVREINENQKKRFISKVKESLWVLNEKQIGVLGLSFKPDTDDLRNAPSLDIIKQLVNEGAKIKAYDPKAMEKAKKVLKGVVYTETPYEAARGSDILLILTEWDEIQNMDLKKIKSLLKNPIIIDGRNIFPPEEMKSLGFVYKGVGR
ncbi:UDP-glucose/GDP-mannose dehydrogenase family protein [bacterium]|nr:UDP-glucose/GDP-mannose dehydrogenase family protein [bacterium]